MSKQKFTMTAWIRPCYDQNDSLTGYIDDHAVYRDGKTAWELACTEVFLVDGKPHPFSWLENEGFIPMPVHWDYDDLAL